MACNLETVLAAACTSGVGKETNPITLLQVIAQLQADYVEAAYPAIDTSIDAVLSRACTSEIGKETDQKKLLQYIAQLLCDQQ